MRHLIAAALALALTTLLTAPGRAQEVYTILTGSVSGVYFPVGGALCRIANRAAGVAGPRCTALPSAGSRANIDALRDGRARFAIVQSDVQAQAVAGEPPFATRGPFDGLRSVLALHVETVTVLVRADDPAASVADLQGRVVNLGPEGSGPRDTGSRLLAALGWSEGARAETGRLGADAQGPALCDGEIDAAVYVVGHPSLVVQDAANLCEVRALTVAGDAVARLVGDAGVYRSAEVPGGLYRGIDAPVASFGTVATLVAGPAADADTVAVLARAALDDPDAFVAMHPALTGLDRSRLAPAGLPAPGHPALPGG